jgi:hypothetical protein
MRIYILPIRATCYTYRIFLHPHKIWWKAKIMNLSIIQFSPTCCYLLSLRPKYLPQHPLYEHLNTRSFLNVKDQVSNLKKITRNIRFLCT